MATCVGARSCQVAQSPTAEPPHGPGRCELFSECAGRRARHVGLQPILNMWPVSSRR
jgi:hypothetical protein